MCKRLQDYDYFYVKDLTAEEVVTKLERRPTMMALLYVVFFFFINFKEKEAWILAFNMEIEASNFTFLTR